MRKVYRYLVLCSAFVLALATQGYAQGKIKVAIWEFDNNAAHTYWYWDRLGPAARNIIDTAFSENRLLSGKFSVIERDKLNLVLKEQGLAQSGAVDPASAAKVGKILGVKYIVLGGIDKFNIDKTGGGFGGIGGSMVQAKATINLRMIDSTTAERVFSVSADDEVKQGGGFVRGASLSHDSEWGIAAEAIQKTAKAVVAKLTTGEYMARLSNANNPTGVMEGKVIKIEGNRAWINMGGEAGIKVGDTFTVWNIGE